MISLQLKNQVSSHSAECLAKIESYLGKSLNQPEIAFNQRGKIAGAALLTKNLVRYNPKLLQENQQVFFDEVIPHEICHIAIFQLFGKVQPHGKEWKTLMQQVFNLEGKATHRLDVTSVQGQIFNYQCQCSQHQLTIRRHNKAQKGSQYICRSCGSQLLYKES